MADTPKLRCEWEQARYPAIAFGVDPKHPDWGEIHLDVLPRHNRAGFEVFSVGYGVPNLPDERKDPE